MKQRFLSICGMIAPVLFLFMSILGGAIRPGYSHISDTISELLSPGSPNKLLLDTLYITFSLLLILFGIGILLFVRKWKNSSWTGFAGASLFIAMGVLQLSTAVIFPQDAWGTPATFFGKMHIFLHGIISIVSLLYMLLIGTWTDRMKIFPGFRLYSFITICAAIISAGLFAFNYGRPYMGLTERMAAIIGFQWTFVLALNIYRQSRN
jgi:hypothetical membrane protein